LWNAKGRATFPTLVEVSRMTKGGSASPTKKNADLNAVQVIRDALEEFDKDKREQIIRWARESLGLQTTAPTGTPTPSPASAGEPVAPPVSPVPSYVPKDIATFVNEKNPQTDMQLAATIAYYYRFAAVPTERKEEIDAESLSDACRLAGRPGKLLKPLITLNNAHAKGLLDRGSARGKFIINSVGENLVGMTLPGGTAKPSRIRKSGPARPKKKAPKRKR
jgi:hypothetical protein